MVVVPAVVSAYPPPAKGEGQCREQLNYIIIKSLYDNRHQSNHAYFEGIAVRKIFAHRIAAACIHAILNS